MFAKLMTDISAECRVQGEVRVSTCQALLACVDGVGVVLVAGQLDALAGDESHELGCKAVEVAYEEIGLEACGKAMRKAAIDGDEEVIGFGEEGRRGRRCCAHSPVLARKRHWRFRLVRKSLSSGRPVPVIVFH